MNLVFLYFILIFIFFLIYFLTFPFLEHRVRVSDSHVNKTLKVTKIPYCHAFWSAI